MKKFAFVSRHVPTHSQMEIARNKGIELVHVGDRDAWNTDWVQFEKDGYYGIIVVHPWSALRAYIDTCMQVGVFNNVKRETGEFEATELFLT